MKVLLLIQRESEECPGSWVEDAVDEYTLDEWGGNLPEGMQKRVETDPGNFRTLLIEIPDGAIERVWDVPVVKGEVVQ